MSRIVSLRLSLTLNAVLVAMLAWSLTDRATTPPLPADFAKPAVSSVHFRWSQLEAQDYPTYIRNLREVGCPEETIRDIITADVASQYAERRKGLVSDGSTPPNNSSSVATSPLGGLAHHESASGPASSDKELLNASATPRRQTLTMQDLDREQATLLASLFPPAVLAPPPPQAGVPPGASGSAEGAPVTGLQRLDPSPAAPRASSALAQKGQRAPGYLTPEQQELRARIGWQAFYFTTPEENDRVRAAQAQGR